jgi:hypothetical protein
VDDAAHAGRALPPSITPEAWHFSLVLGGPLYQSLRRTRLSDGELGLLHRRIAFAVFLMWAPLIGLSALQGGLLPGGRDRPFLLDIGFQLRFLLAAPLLIVAELVVHRRLRPIIAQFRLRDLVPEAQAGRLEAALVGAMRLRNSLAAELLLLALVYLVGVVLTLKRYEAMGGDAWYGLAGEGGRLSVAGIWLVFVSLPLFQFLLLRWYFRLLIWAYFLWRVSRLDLDLNAIHPDRAGGLGFLGDSLAAFAPISMAHGILFAGMIADRIFFAGARLTDFQLQVLAGAVFLVILFAGPLAVFAPRLAQTKRAGLRAYGALGQDYVRSFQAKWLLARPPGDEPLIGSGDIQSLADLGNSFATAEQMRLAPIRPAGLLIFLAAFLLPMAPLALTMMSPEQILAGLLGVVL